MAYQYQPPDLSDLLKIPDLLKEAYTGDNPKRLALITFLQEFVKSLSKFPDNTHITDILLGLYVFEMELIKQEYEKTGIAPDFQPGRLYNTGSQLYSQLKGRLIISAQNNLGDDEALIYLFKCYQFVESNAKLMQLKDSPWGNNEKLLAQMRAMLKQVKTREYDRIAILAEGEPRLEALMQNIAKLDKDYQASVNQRWLTSSWFSNTKKHLSLLTFVRLINESCDQFYKPKPSSCNDSAQGNEAYLEACNVRFGALVYMLITINENSTFAPHGTWLNNGSELFKSTLHALNKKELSAIERDQRIIWLRSLTSHLTKLKTIKGEALKKFAAEGMGIEQLDDIQLEIEKDLVAQREKQKLPRTKRWAIQGTSTAVQYGLSLWATEAVMTALIPTIGVATLASGPIGWIVVGTGALLMTTLGKLVAEKAIPLGVSYLYATVLEKVGNALAEKVVDTTTLAFEVTKENLNKLMGHGALSKDQKRFMVDWIDTLLNLPDEVMSKDEKDQIRTVVGPTESLNRSFVVNLK